MLSNKTSSLPRTLSSSSNSNGSTSNDNNTAAAQPTAKRKRATIESFHAEIARLTTITEYQKRDISNLCKENAPLNKKIDNIEYEANDKMREMLEVIKDIAGIKNSTPSTQPTNTEL